MFELVLRAPQSLVEPLSDLLVDELEALSVTVEDADAGGEGERALFGEPGLPAPAPGWERSTLRALFESEDVAAAAAAAVLARQARPPQRPTTSRQGRPGAAYALDERELAKPEDPTAVVQALQRVPDEDWVRLTQSQFAPVPITERFWVVPSWHEPPAAAELVIRLDPGLAFGTGTHPTTRLCLRWLADHAAALSPQWHRVLDYGCGSGILAIAAAKLGARDVQAVDIDAAAVQSTRDNAAGNGVSVKAALPEVAHGRYPLVLANILATPLKLLAPLLTGHVAPGGWLVLSGILERQVADLQAAYAPHLPIDLLGSDDGWVLMGGHRLAAAP